MIKRICVIGGGAWSENIIRTLFELESLEAVVEPNKERLEYLINKYSCKGVLSLPMHPYLTEDDVDIVCTELLSMF